LSKFHNLVSLPKLDYSLIFFRKYDFLFVRLNDKNYSTWTFKFHIFVKGKDLWVIFKDTQVIAWILGFVDPTIILNLQPYQVFATMWTYLKKVYSILSNFMHRDHVSSLDACSMIYYVKERKCLLTQSLIEEHKSSIVPCRQGKSRCHNLSVVQCFCCNSCNLHDIFIFQQYSESLDISLASQIFLQSLDSLKYNQLRCMLITLALYKLQQIQFTMNEQNTSKFIVTRPEKCMIVESSIYHMSQYLFKYLNICSNN
ncbi:hypothetical protein CR513_61566, partial [Mucuna pruriens]